MTTAAADDPAAQVDELIAAIGARVQTPAVRHGDAVLVTGPWLAGVTGVAEALRERLADRVVVEPTQLARGEAPSAVVLVVSGAAALTDSDCALLDAAAAHTDAVVCAVSKIDVHRGWRDTLADGRDGLAAHAPRYRDVPWVGTAAAPERGEQRVDDLVAALREQLADAGLARRNRLRAWESQLQAAIDRHDSDADGAGRRARVEALHEQRDAALRQRKLSRTERTIALRSRIQQARVQLGYFARNRCTSVRGELQEDTGRLSRRGLPEFERYARTRIDAVVDEVDRGATAHLADVAHQLGLAVESPGPVEPPKVTAGEPALKSRRLETRLTMLLGAGFGLGVALTLSRLLAGLAFGATLAGVAVCAVIGLAVSVWVIGARALLHDRALVDRWVGEATTSLRSAVEELVAIRVVSAESVLSAALSEHDAIAEERLAGQVRQIDGELREYAALAARAAAVRDRSKPALERALETARAELGKPGFLISDDTDNEFRAGESDSIPASGPGI
jgi:hypothetical protein